MVTCEKCGKSLNDNTVFCGYCGVKLQEQKSQTPYENTAVCPRCGSKAASDDVFCPFCGERMQPIEPPSQSDGAGTQILIENTQQDLIKRCQSCRTLTEDDSVFCPTCGHSYAKMQPQPTRREPEPVCHSKAPRSVFQPKTPRSQQKTNRLIVGLILALALVIGVVAGYFTASQLGDAIPAFFETSFR